MARPDGWDVEVVIPAYNESAAFPRPCARPSPTSTGSPGSSRIVVVDNGSVDETAPAARSPPRSATEKVDGRRDRLLPAGQGRRRPPRPADQPLAVGRVLRRRSRHAARHPVPTRSRRCEAGAAAVDRLPARARRQLRAARSRCAARAGGDVFRLLTRKLVPGIARHPVRLQVLPTGTPCQPRARARAAPPASPSTSSCCAAVQRAGGEIVEIPGRLDRRRRLHLPPRPRRARQLPRRPAPARR